MFPRGAIKPDPAFIPDPDSEFGRWSRSLENLTRRVPTTRVLVAIVSGVIAQSVFHHPITWFRRSRPDRQRLAFIYQIIRQVTTKRDLFGLRPCVTFGELLPISCESSIQDSIEDTARQTLGAHVMHFLERARR